MITRTIVCGVCANEHREQNENDGFPGWGQLHGIALDGGDNPHLCPQHLKQVAEYLDLIKHGGKQ